MILDLDAELAQIRDAREQKRQQREQARTDETRGRRYGKARQQAQKLRRAIDASIAHSSATEPEEST